MGTDDEWSKVLLRKNQMMLILPPANATSRSSDLVLLILNT